MFVCVRVCVCVCVLDLFILREILSTIIIYVCPCMSVCMCVCAFKQSKIGNLSQE